MRGFLEDRVQRLESSVHSEMSRVEVISRCCALLPLIVGAALLLNKLSIRVWVRGPPGAMPWSEVAEGRHCRGACLDETARASGGFG